MARNEPFVVGRDSPDRNGQVVGADPEIAACVALQEFDDRSGPARTLHDLGTGQCVMLANPGGEHQRVNAAQGGDRRPASRCDRRRARSLRAPPDLRLLKRLDQSVEQNPFEAAIVEANAVLVVLIEGVHRTPRRGELGRVADISGSCVPCRSYRDIKGNALG